MENYSIVREGFFFRAVNNETGAKSQAYTSASQAGRYIQKKAGADAHTKAYDEFMAALSIGAVGPT